MTKNVSMDEIAKIFNVSKVTVSKALNDKPGVSEKLKQEIKEKAQELGYRMNIAAKSLKTNKSYNIGILIAEKYIGEPGSYYFEIHAKLSQKLAEFDYSSIMEVVTKYDEENLTSPKIYQDSKIDGVIIIGELRQEYLKQFETYKIPVLYFDFYVNDDVIDSIVVDNFYSGYEITELLIKNGHKKIGFIGNIYSTSSIKDRFLGYYRALLENNIEINYDYILSDRDEAGRVINVEVPEVLPTAFVINNDRGAYYFIKKLEEKNIKVPDDISIVSFDNSLFSTLAKPYITTVDNNVSEMVNVTCKAMIKKLSGHEKKYDRILVRGSILERQSVKKIN